MQRKHANEIQNLETKCMKEKKEFEARIKRLKDMINTLRASAENIEK